MHPEPAQGEHCVCAKPCLPSHTDPPTSQPQSQPAQDKQGLPGVPRAAQTSETLRRRKTKRSGLSGDVRENWPMATSSGLFAQVCQIVALKIFPSWEAITPCFKSDILDILPSRVISILRDSRARLVSHPDSGLLVCPPEDVIRGRQGCWGFSLM